MNKIKAALERMQSLQIVFTAIKIHAGDYPGALISSSINRSPVVYCEAGETRRFAEGEVITFVIDITELSDPAPGMLQADEERKRWKNMFGESAHD